MLRTVLTAMGGTVGLALLWLAVQLWVRRATPGLRADQDLLEHWAHGCHHCPDEENCSLTEGGKPPADCPPPGDAPALRR